MPDINMPAINPLQASHTSGGANSLIALDKRLCPGCKQSAVNETGGLVVAFGQSFFHVDCFRCAKCGDRVTADTNLLLLSDGSPICANCSYNCNICRQPILDEAIMTGDDSYHAHCFKCKVCNNRIEDLVFAKTTQGIYCMNCHNERMAKARRYAQKKKEREKAAGGSGSSATRESEAREYHKLNGTSSSMGSLSPPTSLRSKGSAATFRDGSSVQSAGTFAAEQTSTTARKRKSSPLLDEAAMTHDSRATGNTAPAGKSSEEMPHIHSSPPYASSYTQKQPLSVTIHAPETDPNTIGVPNSSDGLLSSESLSPKGSLTAVKNSYVEESNKLLLSPSSAESPGSSLLRRKSFDDSIKPPSLSSGRRPSTQENAAVNGRKDASMLAPPNGLTSRTDKRRSINHTLTFDLEAMSSELSRSMLALEEDTMIRSQTLPLPRSDSPSSASAFKPSFADLQAKLPLNDYLHDNASTSTIFHSPPSSPLPPDKDYPASGSSSRARSASGSHRPEVLSEKDRPSTPQRLPMRSAATLDRVPPRSASLNTANPSDSLRSASHSADGGLTPIVSTPESSTLRSPRLFEESFRLTPGGQTNSRSRSSSNSGLQKRHSALITPVSPSHPADVPHSIESGTESEVDAGSGRQSEAESQTDSDEPPALPPKENVDRVRAYEVTQSGDSSNTSQFDGSISEDEFESEAIQRTSIATFIAPALPPIRFSMTGADFSDLLKSVGGGSPSVKSVEQMAKVYEEEEKSTTASSKSQSPSSSSQDVTTKFSTPAMGPSENSSLYEGSATANGAYANKTTLSTPATPRTQIFHRQEKTSFDTLAERTPIQDVSNLRSLADEGKKPQISTESFTSRVRTSSDSHSQPSRANGMRKRQDSTPTSTNGSSSVSVVITSPDTPNTDVLAGSSTESVTRRLQEYVFEATARGSQQIKFEKSFVETILKAMEERKSDLIEEKRKYDGVKRASQQYIDGLTVAQTEYDRELKARREAEAEVVRLRVLLSGQAAKLTALSADVKKQETQQQLSQELNDALTQLESDLSKLRVERDMALAEVEEICASKSSPDLEMSSGIPSAQMSRSLTMRLDNIKTQYQRELVPLTQQREALLREIAELRTNREQFLEETTVLHARNEELAQLNAQYARRVEAAQSDSHASESNSSREESVLREKQSTSFDRNRSQPQLPPSLPSLTLSTASSSTLAEDAKYIKVQRSDVPENMTPMSRAGKFIKWPGSRVRDLTSSPAEKGKGRFEHVFQQVSVLRFTRCYQCGEKLFGSQLRCSGCHISIHTRCVNSVPASCTQQEQLHSSFGREEPVVSIAASPPSMFGRDLTEQVRADSKYGERKIPIIVEKCIEAVEESALDLEGIYRKTGGSGQSRAITQLFEQGDYNFDLKDSERFNDICSVTSVLKTYLRSLPIPLLTYDLHDEFMRAASIKDSELKGRSLQETVDKLPTEHYHTLRLLMLHLHRISEHSDVNLMTPRNLGVVFGPTLMRSPDPAAEFSDMAGKATSIEWLVDNARSIFMSQASSYR